MNIVHAKKAAEKLGVSYSFTVALKKGAGIKSRLFEFERLRDWWRDHPDFKKNDVYARKSHNAGPPEPVASVGPYCGNASLKQKRLTKCHIAVVSEALQAKGGQKRFVGLRMRSDLYERVGAVAQAQSTSARAVIEQCLNRALPELEKLYDIHPPSSYPDRPSPADESGLQLRYASPERTSAQAPAVIAI
jgi:hypothetical protein